jgi:hypothetical protein
MIASVKKYCTFVILVVYCFGLAVPMVHHHAEDATGSGRYTVAPHADADHCKHIPIAAHDDCALCSTHNGKAAAAVSYTPIFSSPVRALTFLVQDPYSHRLHFLSSQTHRGPPSLLG